MSLVYLLLGGNMGERDKFLSNAIELIRKEIGIEIARSSLYSSPAWGFIGDDFINQAIIIKTSLNPFQVLHRTQLIEKELGRTKKGVGYQSRPIDIDLLYSDNLVIFSEKLTLPHPRMAQRNFVLQPLNEIAPELTHPLLGMTTAELLEKCCDDSVVNRIVTG